MYGLLGKSLSHSRSPEIHRLLGNADYRLFESPDPKFFLSSKLFTGINVTIPYKESVIPLLDELDPVARATGAVNTVLNNNGRLVGYNTDVFGFEQLLVHAGINPYQKKVLILGNGGAAKACAFVLHKLGAKQTVKLCRRIKSENEFLFSEIEKVVDSEIIINTTPLGMYPENDSSVLIDLNLFYRLDSVIDLIYNPLHTNLLLDAKSKDIFATNGLYMLVSQAAKSNELFTGIPATKNQIDSVFSILSAQMTNLVLIGLPGSGKSSVAGLLAKGLKKTVADCDQLISDAAGMSISDIFASFGEPYFRNLEYELTKGLYQNQGLVISTGGGMVENDNLMRLLRQNGLLVFLDRPITFILKESVPGRPLLKTPEDLLALEKRRRSLYEKYADIRYESVSNDPASEAALIKERFYGYFDNQRA